MFAREGGLPVWHVSADGRRTACGVDVLATDMRRRDSPDGGEGCCTACAMILAEEIGLADTAADGQRSGQSTTRV